MMTDITKGINSNQRIYKGLFPHTNIKELNKSINKKYYCAPIITHACNKWAYAG